MPSVYTSGLVAAPGLLHGRSGTEDLAMLLLAACSVLRPASLTETLHTCSQTSTSQTLGTSWRSYLLASRRWPEALGTPCW